MKNRLKYKFLSENDSQPEKSFLRHALQNKLGKKKQKAENQKKHVYDTYNNQP